MIKVLLVDDELLIRTNLKLMLDWSRLGFAVCGEAANGIEALALAERERPDLIVSDIRMPRMDGLELSRELARRFPRVKLIVLSNFDDFDYVKGALQNGAVDYLLKHRLNEAELTAALMRAKEQLPGSSGTEGGQQAADKPNANHMLALKKTFIVQLIAGFAYSQAELDMHIGMLRLKLDTRNVVPVIVSVDDYRTRLSDASLKATELLQYSIVNIAEEILNEAGNGAFSHMNDEKFVILFSFPHVRSEAEIERSLHEAIARISNCLRAFLNISVSFSIGPMCVRIAELPGSCRQAEAQMKERFYRGKNVILKNNPLHRDNDVIAGLDIGLEKQLTSSLKRHDSQAVTDVIEHVFSRIQSDSLSLESSQIIFNDLLSLLHRVAKENRIELAALYPDQTPPHESLSRFETLDEVKRWFAALFGLYFQLSLPDQENHYSDYARKAIHYIRNHYGENISQADAADYAGISSTYLSTIFKNEVGLGFSEYLCDVRLGSAKAYLEEGQTDMKDIARLCGFNNYNYFFNTFKKKIGVTPGEYAKQAKK